MATPHYLLTIFEYLQLLPYQYQGEDEDGDKLKPHQIETPQYGSILDQLICT